MHQAVQALVGPTIADQASSYTFERHLLSSVDGQRKYQIDMAIPSQASPPGGFAVLYMLDGNAAMDTLTQADLTEMARKHPPVLVAIGYDEDTRHDANARAYDYTPPYPASAGRTDAPVVRGRAGGGAEVFFELIQNRIKPLVATRASVNAQQEYLWGHSYGGLFTLYTFLTHPDAFSRYIAGDPSGWWNDGVLAQFWKAFDIARATDRQVTILLASRPGDTRRAGAASCARPESTTPADPCGTTRLMVDTLNRSGHDATFEAVQHASHGDMLPISLKRAMQLATTP